nr:MAG TPA: hypothetical protein [Caudoviricetes sp.]
MFYPSETPMNKGFPCSFTLPIVKPLRSVPHILESTFSV